MNRIPLLFLLLVAVGVQQLNAMQKQGGTASGSVSDEASESFTIGLALSGGGATGLAHIGVLKVLEEEGIPVDVVAGTSMGAIVGGLYAIGYTPDQLEHVALGTDWRQLFEEPIFRRHLPLEEKKYDGRFLLSFPVAGRTVELPTGLVSGTHTFNLLARLTWSYHDVEDFTTLPRPFACIATDLQNGEQVILDRGFLPDAIRASMSIPSIFDPVWVDGKYLVDGGLVNNMPVQEAYGLGADYVIAINSSSDLKPVEELHTLPDILTQTIAVGMQRSMLMQREKADFYIQPDLEDYATFSFGDIHEIIKAGEDAARAQIDEIRELADSLKQVRRAFDLPVFPAFEPTNTLKIRNVTFEGLQTIPADHVRTKLQIEDNSTITQEQLNEGLLRLYGMRRFSQVTYRLRWDDDQADIAIRLEEQTANIIQAGIHHNSTLGPSLLFNATFRNLFFPASTARLNVRVGHEFLAEADYYNYIGLEPRRLTFHGSAGFREREIDIYQNGHRQANLRTDILYGEGLIGPLYASVLRAGFGYRFERFNLTESYGALEVPFDWNSLQILVGEMEFDNLNRSHIPTNGQYLLLRADMSPRFLPNDAAFGRISGRWSGFFRITDDLTLISGIRGGYIFGGHPPLHYRFYAGGHDTFWGYPKEALAGNNLLTGRLAAQYRFHSNLYATAGMNMGNAYERIDLSILDSFPRWGWGTAIGWNTVIGPIQVTLSGSNRHALLYEFQVGINF